MVAAIVVVVVVVVVGGVGVVGHTNRQTDRQTDQTASQPGRQADRHGYCSMKGARRPQDHQKQKNRSAVATGSFVSCKPSACSILHPPTM